MFELSIVSPKLLWGGKGNDVLTGGAAALAAANDNKQKSA
jgi:hypothetical protein